MPYRLGPISLLILFAWSFDVECPAADPSEGADRAVAFFESDVLPILKAHCFKCHGGEPRVKSGLRLTSRAGILAGGDLGPSVVPGKPAESRLIAAINYRELEMPPQGKLPAEQVQTLTRWVRDGLAWSAQTQDYGVPPAAAEPAPDDGHDYWAYQRVRRPDVPGVRDPSWVRNPIDAFLLTKMESAGVHPAQRADPLSLVRRAYYDLTGLPPSPEDVDAFSRDPSEAAYEAMVDRLLDSPQYGEKWGRHWLDLVRYAETHGYERDSPKPEAWRYRDYVIASFNQDKPYDQFLREQLAGDEGPNVTAESLTATGYYRLGLWDDEPADRLLARYDGLDDIVKTTAEVMLGMSLGCARCHDHKGDPLPQRDYYGFLAWFHDTTPMNRENLRRFATSDDRKQHERMAVARRQREDSLHAESYQIERQFLLALESKLGVGESRLRKSDLEGLSYRFYRDTWERLPDFDALKPETVGQMAGNFFSLRPASRQEAIGLVFEARLRTPQAGEYTFAIQSTDGARLLVDGQQVASRAERSAGRVEATVTLPAGMLPIRLEYFNTYSKPELSVTWSGPGVPTRYLTDDALSAAPVLLADSRKDGQSWRFSLSEPADDWTEPAFDAASWTEGLGGFGRSGTPGAVVRTPWETADIWLRTTFALAELPTHLALDLHHDEDVEIFLNGQAIHAATGFTTDYQRVPLPPESLQSLRVGDNVLAVHCRQTGGGQYVDVGLVAAAADVDLAGQWERHGRELLGQETFDRYARLAKELEASRKSGLEEPGTPIMAIAEEGFAPAHLLIRGNPHAEGPQVDPAVPAALDCQPPVLPTPTPGAQSSGKRSALANWIASPNNPLTARVLVNRLWQHHFGRSIVPTPNDFGKFGELPTHPELLDWLASEFTGGGWKIKRMHKQILMSQAWRMSSRATAEGLEKDPGNHLFWRYNIRRLTAEEIRDSILSVTGELNLKAGGPSIYTRIPQEVLQGQSMPGAGWGDSPVEEQARRSIYIHVKRSLLVPILEAHDQADTDSSCPVRYVTTVPTQSLEMLNGDFTNEKAARLADRLARETPDDQAAQVRRAIRLTTSRVAGEDEVAADVALLRDLQAENGLSAAEALRVYCLMAFNTNEFVYLD